MKRTRKYHAYILKGIQDTEQTRIYIKGIKGEITKKLFKREL